MLCLAAAGQPMTLAQGPPQMVACDTLATFQTAAALDTDLMGRLYVVDRGGGTLTKMDTTGVRLAVWGGPGSGNAQFDEPMDVDATNGLELFVADAGNRRVKRFSGEFVPLESIGLGIEPGVAALGESRAVQPEFADLKDGRPVSVALAADGSLFALDADRNVVLKWTRGRRLERVFGGYDAGEGALVEPVGLALGPEERILVADAGRRSIVVYNRFGSFQRTIGGEQLRGLTSVQVFGSGILAVLAHEVRVYAFGGLLQERYEIPLEEPLRDAAVLNGQLYVLTPTALLRVRFD